MSAFEQLEAWRLADPDQRGYTVNVVPSSRSDCHEVQVTLSEGRTGRIARAYDLDDDGDPTRPKWVTLAGHRCGVARVIEAALERWRELYSEGGQ